MIDANPIKQPQKTPAPVSLEFKADNADLETEVDDLSFSNFRFKSFRTHKLIEEDYSLLQVDDPDEVPMIVTKEIMSDERLSKDGIELVAIDEKQLR